MGIPAWIWFVIAAVAAVAGLALLMTDRARESSRNRERARWAELRGWQYVEEDEELPREWSGGAIGYFGAEAAVNVVAGSTFTSDGRRPVFVFDIVADGVIPSVVVAVRCNRVQPVLLELWLASVPFQRAEMPELLGPVGQRYAFADEVTAGRALVTQELVEAADALGGDVGVAWIEEEWVLASVAPNVGPSRLERLLRDLGEIADIIDPSAEAMEERYVPPQASDMPAPGVSGVPAQGSAPEGGPAGTAGPGSGAEPGSASDQGISEEGANR